MLLVIWPGYSNDIISRAYWYIFIMYLCILSLTASYCSESGRYIPVSVADTTRYVPVAGTTGENGTTRYSPVTGTGDSLPHFVTLSASDSSTQRYIPVTGDSTRYIPVTLTTTTGEPPRYLSVSASREPTGRYIAVSATNSEITRYLPVTVTSSNSVAQPRYLVTSGNYLMLLK